ncbi:MAG TPA: PrsW family glutamic-type intramembrane protease [Candidatus Paceibacterota bacterium]|nr:PrsW family glutamic-type intramembrane protease [Candidatus Paceibacterota bacterium]
MEAIPLETIGYAFLGGILPAFIWLYFLLKEDSRCPEPRSMIMVAVIAGMIAVPASLPFESYFASVLAPGLPVLVAWAAVEETMKYLLASLLVLWRRSVNESVDLVIYMITVALGFAALENVLFLIGPFMDGRILDGLFTNNLRFVGATLLHVIASSMIGFALAFAYLRTRRVRMAFATIGLILAIALHALFNFLIIAPGGSHTLTAFFLVWSGAIVFFALFEILKYFRYRHLPKNTC